MHLLSFIGRASGECQENVRLSLRTLDESKAHQILYKFESDTQKCDKEESRLISSEARFCDSQDLDVTFSSVPVLPNGTNMLPYVLLNISVRVTNPTSSIFLRLECLEAPNLEDDYCHNHEEQYRRWGRMIWPCRSLSLLEPDLVRYPYFFDYHCFWISAYSRYRLNVSRSPNSCRKSFIVTIPEEAQLHSAISRFYDPNAETGFNHWSPLAFVDLSLQDGVLIRYGKQPALAIPRMTIALFEATASSLTHLFTDTIDIPADEYMWENVPAGNYTAYLYVNRFDCDLMCGSDFVRGDEDCVRCPSTRIHFTVQEDKIWLPLSTRSLPYHHIAITGAVVLCFALLAAFIAYSSVIWRRQNVTTREVSLSQRTTVFIAYTDDCKPHSDCVAALAKMLQQEANADVFLDQLELKCSETVPARWFIDKLAAANHVLLIFSEGASAVLRGESLIEQQPFPEFFPSAINFTILECNKHPVKLPPETSPRFAFAHFTYSLSSVILVELAALPVNTFKLPEQVGKLILWLHDQPVDGPINVQIDSSQLESAVNEVLQYRHENPTWLADRLQTKQKDVGSVFSPQNIPFQACRPMLTLEEQVRIAEALNLEPPDILTSTEEIHSQEDARFALIGSPDDSSSDSDDSASEKILLQQLLAAKQSQD